jgi:hypothetical protein
VFFFTLFLSHSLFLFPLPLALCHQSNIKGNSKQN